MSKTLRNFINGIAFGVIETVPGVSGGTIAIILGFYYELIDSINHFTKHPKKNLKFLLPLLIGTACGVLAFSSLMNYLLTNFSFPTMSFFIGLITGIIPIVFFKVRNPGGFFGPFELTLIIVPIVVLVISTHFKDVTITNPAETMDMVDIPYMIFIFFAGILASAALIIPGVSGSFVLLLLGIYPMVTYTLSTIALYFSNISNTALLLNICKILIPLGVGIIIGGLSMARLIGKLLRKYNRILYCSILGLLIGSVYSISHEPILLQSGFNIPFAIAGGITFLCGGTFSFCLGKKRF